MRRWRVLIIVIVLIGIFVGAYRWYKWREQRKRDAFYQATLKSYSERFPVGVDRAVVETYFQTTGIQFEQTFGGSGVKSDYVLIGQESPPWYCSAWGVYVVFDWAHDEQDLLHSGRSSTLQKIRLEGDGLGCL